MNQHLNGHSDIAVGNVIGSCICNLLLVLGCSSIVRPLIIKKESKIVDIPLNLIAIVLILIFGNQNFLITKKEGIILLAIFAVFILYTVISGSIISEQSDDDEQNKQRMSLIKSIILIGLGVLGLKFGGDFVVDNSVEIAEFYNVSERIISLTIIAIGTSLPELVTGCVAAKKGDTDIAVGNALGSNIFNLLLVLGIGAVIKEIEFSIEFNMQLIFLFASTLLILLFTYMGKSGKISRKKGLVLFLCFIGYICRLLILG